MLLHRLSLTAVGPFTGQELSFCEDGTGGGGPCGLHVIHGPNEAGKSSALRALRALLFGFHARTDDAFLHTYNDLRVGALVSRNGEAPRRFTRRKGNANTILDDAGQPVADGELTSLYRHVTEQKFDRFHGITHAELIEGGARLLDGDGELGEALFGASDQGRLLGELRVRAEEEVKKRLNSQNNGTLREAIDAYRQRRQAAEDKSLDPQAWRRMNDELASATKERASVDATLATLAGRIATLCRIRNARPHLGRRQLVLERLRDLQSLPDLPTEFDGRVEQAVATWREADRQLTARISQLAKTAEELQAIPDPAMLLVRANVVDGLVRDARTAAEARSNLPALHADANAAERRAEQLRQDVAPDVDPAGLSSLRLPRDRRERIAELADEHPELQRRLATARELVANVNRRLESLGEADDSAPAEASDSEALALALQRSRAEGNVSGQLRDLRQERVDLADRAERIAAHLAPRLLEGSSEDLAGQLATLAVPAEEVVAALAEVLADAARAIAAAQDTVEAREDEVRRTEQELQAIREENDVPEEVDLADARQRRDALRQNVIEAWRAEQPLDASVADEYERAVSHADAVADAMRSAAEQVTKLKIARRDRERAATELEVVRQRHEMRRIAHKEEQVEWVEAWRKGSIDAGSVAEMTAWRRQHENLRDAVATIASLDKKIARLTKLTTDHIDLLMRLLGEQGETFRDEQIPADPPARLAALQALADRAVNEANRAQVLRERRDEERREAQREADDANDRIEQAQIALSDWEAQWQAALKAANRLLDERPAATVKALQAVQQLLDAADDAQRLRTEAEVTQQATAAFDARVESERTAFAALLAEEERRALESANVGGAVQLLRQHVDVARGRAAQREQLQKTQAQLVSERSTDEAEVKRARAAITTLARSAGVTDDDLAALESVARRHAERRATRQSLDAIDERLAEIGGGTRDVEALLREADDFADLDDGALASEIQQVEERREAQQAQRDALQQKIGRLMQQREEMDGRANAAEAAEEAAAVLGRVEAEMNAYARAMLTAEALRRAVDRHRDAQKAPLVEAASAAFATLTAGHFRGVRIFVDSRDRRLLGGIRREDANGEAPVPVSGMSDGTRDALYLALRLAHLRADARTNGPFPLVMDDVLVNADEERTAATLAALRDFATESAGQVVYFTHHRHVADLAAQAGGRVQYLDRPSAIVAGA